MGIAHHRLVDGQRALLHALLAGVAQGNALPSTGKERGSGVWVSARDFEASGASGSDAREWVQLDRQRRGACCIGMGD